MKSLANRDSGGRSRRVPLLLALAAGALAAVFIFIVLGILIWLFGTAIPDDREHAAASRVHAAFELSLEDGRIADAYALTSTSFQQKISFDRFRELIDRHQIIKGRPGTHWSKDDAKTDHKSGSHEFKYTMVVQSDEEVVSYTYIIIVESGRAKIDSLTFP